MSTSIDNLAELFKLLPGVGKRQAQRYVHAVLRKGPSYAKSLALSLQSLHQAVAQCSWCRRYEELSLENLCHTCAGKDREQDMIMIVATDADCDALEKTRTYKGLYFILGGLARFGDDDWVTFQKGALKERLQIHKVSEVVLALPTNTEGEYTAQLLLDHVLSKINVTVSELGRGMSTGLEIEYSDTKTLEHALSLRRTLK